MKKTEWNSVPDRFYLYPRKSWCKENKDGDHSLLRCTCGTIFIDMEAFMAHHCAAEGGETTQNVQRQVGEHDESTIFQCTECKNYFKSMRVFNSHKCALNKKSHETEVTSQPTSSSAMQGPSTGTTEQKGTCNLPFNWNKTSTLLLISSYRSFKDSIDSGKIKKKVVWEKISETLKSKGYDVTGEQVAGRWKSLLRGYKNVKDHNKTSGNDKKQYEYEDELDDIIGNDPTITPSFTISSESSSRKRKDDSDDTSGDENESIQSTSSASSSGSSNKKVKKSSTAQKRDIVNIFESYINDQKAERARREEMHRERIDVMKSLIEAIGTTKSNNSKD